MVFLPRTRPKSKMPPDLVKVKRGAARGAQAASLHFQAACLKVRFQHAKRHTFKIERLRRSYSMHPARCWTL